MQRFITKYSMFVAIALFIFLFSILHFLWKPAMIYLPNGQFRTFGVGYKHRTIITGWIAATILAIFCYMAVKYAGRRPRLAP